MCVSVSTNESFCVVRVSLFPPDRAWTLEQPRAVQGRNEAQPRARREHHRLELRRRILQLAPVLAQQVDL